MRNSSASRRALQALGQQQTSTLNQAATTRPDDRLSKAVAAALEQLEARRMLAGQTWVNDNWYLASDTAGAGAGQLSVGDVVDNRLDTNGAPTVQKVYGVDGFGTITGGTIVDADDNVVRDFAVQPSGAVATDPAAARTINHAIAATDPAGIVRVLRGTYTENVLVDKNVELRGAQFGNVISTTDAHNRGAVSAATVANETHIKGAAENTPVFTVAASGATINGFLIDGNGKTASQGVYESTGLTGTKIRYNLVRNTAGVIGISLAAGSTGSFVQHNDVSGAHAGIYLSANASNVTVQRNRLHGMTNSAGPDAGSAIVLEGNNTNTLITANAIWGNRVGLYVWNFGTNFHKSEFSGHNIGDNILAGNAIGIDTIGGPLLIAKNTIKPSAETGIGIRVSGSGSLNLGEGNEIIGGGTGLVLDGAGVSVAGNSLSDLQFTNQAGKYIQVTGGTLDNVELDATRVKFGSETDALRTGGARNTAENFELENRIDHALDVGTAGFVRVRAGQAFVTQESGSIQRGVDVATATGGDTVHVRKGTYDEATTINKSLSLIGDNKPTVTRTSGANQSLLTVTAPTVTIDGFELVVTKPYAVAGVHAPTGSNSTGLTVLNNTITSQGSGGIFAPISATLNRSAGIAALGSGNGYTVTIKGNTIGGDPATSLLSRGVWVLQAAATIGGPDATDVNTITASIQDVLLSFPSWAATTLQNNTFRGAGVDVTEPNGTGTVSILGNTFAPVLPASAQSLLIKHSYAGAPVTVQGNTFTGHTVAVRSGGSKNVTIHDNDFDAAGANVVHVDVDTRWPGTPATPYVANDATITGNTFLGAGATAIRVANGNGTQTGTDFGTITVGGAADGAANAFDAALAKYIKLVTADAAVTSQNATVNIDATGNTFAGKAPADMIRPAELWDVEDKVDHAVDTAGLGFVRISPKEVFVTPASGSIQRGLDAAQPGDTVYIQAGTYNETLVVNKTVTLVGQTDADGKAQVTLRAPSNVGALASLVKIDGALGDDGDVTLQNINLDGLNDTARAAYGVRVDAGASMGKLTVQNGTISNFSYIGVIVNGKDATGLSARDVELRGLTFTGNGTSGEQGVGDVSLFKYNGNATLANLKLTGNSTSGSTGARYGIQIRGVGTATNGRNAIGTVKIDGVDITGGYRTAFLGLTYYSSLAGLSLNNVALGGGTSAITHTWGGALRFDGVGTGTIAIPATVDLGNTLFRGLAGAVKADVEFAPDQGGTFLRADATKTRWAFDNGTPVAALSLSPAQLLVVEDRINHYVDGAATLAAASTLRGFAEVRDGQAFVTATPSIGGSINRAIEVVDQGGTVHLGAGTFAQNVVLNRGVDLAGAGRGVNPVSASIITGAGTGPVVTLTASGTVGGSPLLIRDLTIMVANKIGIEVPAGVTVANVALDGVDVVGSTPKDNSENERGLSVPATASINGLSVIDSSFRDLFYGWAFYKAATNDASNVTGVLVTGSEFRNNTSKGVYAEKLDDATFRDVAVVGNGYWGGVFNTDFAAGIDVNLKFGTYAQLRFEDLTVTGNGVLTDSPQLNIAGTPGVADHAAGLTIKARDDGSYTSNPATLTGVQIIGGTYDGNWTAIRIGEAGVANAGPTGTSIAGATITGNKDAGVILTGGDVTIDGVNFDSAADGGDNASDLRITAGSKQATIGNNIKFAGDQYFIDNRSAKGLDLTAQTGITFDVAGNYRIEDRIAHKVDDLSKGLVTWVAGNVFVTDGGTDHSIQRGIDAAEADWTVNVEAGSYAGGVNVNKDIDLIGSGLPTVNGFANISGSATGMRVSAAGAKVEGFELVGSNVRNSFGIFVASGAGGAAVEGNTIRGFGDGVASEFGASNLQISGNTIKNNLGAGIRLQGGTGTDVLRNIVSQNVAGVVLDNAKDTEIAENEIDDNVDSTRQWGNGIGIDGDVAGTVIRNNYLRNNGPDGGIFVASGAGYAASASSNLGAIFENAITGPAGTVGLKNNTPQVLAASNNWWGHAHGPTGGINSYPGANGAKVIGSAQVAGWLADGTDQDTAAIGFQPDAANPFYPITNNEGEFYSTIEAAIAGTTAGSGATITIKAGFYDEAVTVDRQVKLLSDGGSVTVGSITLSAGANVGGSSGVTSQSVTVNGAKVQDGISLAGTGATVTVTTGTYTDAVVVDRSVTLAASGNVKLDFSNKLQGLVVNANGVTVDGFDIVGNAATNFGVWVRGDGVNARSGITLKNNKIHGMGKGQSAQNLYAFGILVDNKSGANANTVSGLTITGNNIYGIGNGTSSAGSAISLLDVSGAVAGTGATVSANNFINNIASIGTAAPGVGVYAPAGSGVAVAGNDVRNTGIAALIGSSKSSYGGSAFTNVGAYLVHANRSTADVSVNLSAAHAKSNNLTGRANADGYFSSAQLAVDSSVASTGLAPTTVTLSAHTFEEQVVVTKDLSIVGVGPASVLKAPASLDKSVTASATGAVFRGVVMVQQANLNLSNLTVDGARRAEALPNAGHRFNGVAFVYGGGSLDGVTVTGVRYAAPGMLGMQNGVAVYAYNGSDNAAATARTLSVTRSTIADYQKGGIVANGNLLTATVSGNTVAGLGATTAIAQNGIQIGFGARATITGNAVTGNVYTGASSNVYDSAGILLYQAGAGTVVGGATVADKNTLNDNDVGVMADSSTAEVRGNTITGNVVAGVDAYGGTTTIRDNVLTGNGTGIRAAQNAAGNNAVVDAGTGADAGGNVLTGYTGTGGNYAIVNENAAPGSGPQVTGNVSALGNNFGAAATPAQIEAVVFHDSDDAALGFVDYAGLGGLTVETNDGDNVIDEGDEIRVSGSFTNDPQPHTVRIKWGDSEDANTDTVLTLATNDFSWDFSEAPHTYVDNGTYNIVVIVTDATNTVVDTTTIPIVVKANNVDPQDLAITPDPANSLFEGQKLSFTASATDPGGQDDPLDYAWEVFKGSDTTAFESGSGTAITFTPDDNETYRIELTVTDGDEGESTLTYGGIVVANVAPTVGTFVVPATGVEGTAVAVSAAAADAAQANDTLTYTWKVFKNGNTTTPFAEISAVDQTSWSFTPNDNGSYVVELVVTDEDGGVASTQAQTISVTNVAPQDVTITADPANQLKEGSLLKFTGSATDPAGGEDTLSYSWQVFKEGLQTAYATGTGTAFQFVPRNQGSYTVVLTVTDEDSGSTPAEETYTVVNVKPSNVAPDLGNMSTSVEGQTVTLTGSFVDPGDQDGHTIVVSWGDTKTDSFAVGAVDATGTTASGAAWTYVAATRTFTITHVYVDDNPTGTPSDQYTIGVTVTDDSNASDSGQTTAIVNNVAPVVTIEGAIEDAPVPTTGSEGTPLGFTSDVTDAGVLDTFSYLWTVAKDGQSYTVTGNTGPAFSFVPTDNGSYVVTLAVTDDDGATTTVTTAPIIVGNVAPTIADLAVAPGVINEGGTVTLTGTINDAGSGDEQITLLINWGNGQTETQTVTRGVAFSFTHTYVDDNPTGTTFDVYNVGVTATDDDGGAASQTLTDAVRVNNVAPAVTIGGTGLNGGPEASALSFSSNVTDLSAGNDTYTYLWSVTKNGAAYAVAGNTTANFTFTPDDDASYIVTLQVTDDDGGVTTVSTPTITVSDVAPTVFIESLTNAINESQAASLTFRLLDPGAGDLAATGQVVINWGNGTQTINSSTAPAVLAALRDGQSVTLTRLYTDDNPTATPADTYNLSFNSTQTTPTLIYNAMSIGGTGGSSVTVNNVAPTGVFLVNEPTVAAGSPVSVNWIDQNDASPDDLTSGLRYSYGVDANANGTLEAGEYVIGDGTYAGGSTADAATIPGSYFASPGTYTILGQVIDDDGGVTTVAQTVTVTATTFRVSSMTPTASGFLVNFNRAFDRSVLNLYKGTGSTFGTADVVLTGPGGATVRGSIKLSADNKSFEFVKTGGVVAPGAYSVTIVSGADALKDGSGELLDGDGNLSAGGNFIGTFNVAAPTGPVLSIPDFARGPGQTVDVPRSDAQQMSAAADLPVLLSTPVAVSSLNFQVKYDPTLLDIAASGAVSLGSAVPAGWSVGYTVSGGVLSVSLTKAVGSAANIGSSATPLELVKINATVPTTATYGSSQVLSFQNVVVNGSSGIVATGDRAFHKAVFLGDASANGVMTSGDASLIQGVVLGQQSGFNAMPLVDAVVVTDSSRNGLVDAQDVTNVALTVVDARPDDIPAFVQLNPAYTAGVDPTYHIGSNIKLGGPGKTFTVPVSISDDARGVASGKLTLTYDTTKLDLSGANVTAGQLTNGWSITPIVNDATGTVTITFLTSPNGAITGTSAVTGSILNLQFTVAATATSGLVPLTIAPSNGLGGPTYFEDAETGYMDTLVVSGSVDIDADGPAVTSSDFEFETNNAVTFTFTEDVSASLSLDDLQVTNLGTGQLVPTSNWTLQVSPDGTVAKWVYNGILPDGNYKAIIAAGKVADAAGNANAAQARHDFFAMTGDFNRDRKSDFADLGILLNNYNATGKTFSQGDANYDGVADFADLGILLNNYNKELALPTPEVEPTAPVTAVTTTPVEQLPIREAKPAKTPVAPKVPAKSTAKLR